VKARISSRASALLAEFRGWLDRERGLSPVSVRCYARQSKAFLAGIGGAGAVSALDAGKVTAFMVDWAQGRNTWSAKAMVTSLRAFLRFAHATGRTAVPLAGAVPAVASWRMTSLPRGLKAAEIERLLAGCERDTAAGLRDYAVLSLLARRGFGECQENGTASPMQPGPIIHAALKPSCRPVANRLPPASWRGRSTVPALNRGPGHHPARQARPKFPHRRRPVNNALTIDELRALPATIDLPTAARALGLGRTKAYDLAKRGQFPCRLLRIGGAYRIPTAELLRYVGIEPLSGAGA